MHLNHYRVVIAAIVVVASIGFASTIHANQYIGIDGSSLSLDGDSGESVNTIGVRVRMGLRLSELFDLEAHFGGGNDSSTRTFDELSVAYFGLYLKGHLPLGRRSALYLLAGGAGVELTQFIGRSKFSANRNGLSYGFGLETRLSEYWDVSADFVRYSLNDENFSEVSVVNLGLKWYF